MNKTIPIVVLPPVLLLGMYLGRYIEQYKMQNNPEYYTNTCADNNSKHDESERLSRCEQSYKLFNDKENLDD